MEFKTVNIGILTINNFDFHPNSRLRQAAKKQGYDIILINPYDMTAGIKKGEFEYFIDKINKNLAVVMPRQGSPMGDYGLVLLRHFGKLGIPLVNNLKIITISRNQFITLQALASSGILVPNTCFITKKELFLQAVNKIDGFPVIVKQVDGMGGDGVIKVNNEKEAIFFLEKNLKERKGVLVQQFIPSENRIDIRVLVIGGKVAGAMKLESRNDDFRTNIHQKGKAQKVDLSKDLENMAIKSAKACHLEIAGVDILMENSCHPLVIEVNYSPGFQGLEAATGLDIAQQIIDYVSSTHGNTNHTRKDL
jgi:ribosomal protein S6--L-glutamate ligase